tara:strand:+ start:5 stop:943 length:939 start_codon:yes stop_codon:yes gene_type:complete
MKSSLTLILSCLIIFIVSCSSIPNQNQDKSNTKLNLKIQTSNKNKEIIIESLLKENVEFSINFDTNNSFLLKDELLDSNLKYFCKTFMNEQRDIIESAVFNKEDDDKRILIIYSDKYINSVSSIKKKHPKELYYLLSNKDFENNIQKILHVNQSIKRYSQISNLDKNLEIQHNPRVRKDISKIYFLIDYELGKTIVPIFKNYALGMDFYSTSELFHGATDIKKLADFEGTYIPLSSEIFKKIINKKNITNIKNEFEILTINDFLKIEKIYQNNLYKRNILLKTGYTKFQKNKCINRNLPIWKIDMNNLTLRT